MLPELTHRPFKPLLRELIAYQADAWLNGALPYEPRHVIAVVAEGHCPRCLGPLVPGRHGPAYGWCTFCDEGWQVTGTEAPFLLFYLPDHYPDGAGPA